MGPRACLDAVMKRELPCPSRESNPGCAARSSVTVLAELPRLLLDSGYNSSSSFLGSTAQLRPWPPPQNPAEFLGGFSTIFFTG
jgi:hypothetical protein